MMMRHALIAAALCALATPGLALSCLRPDVTTAFQQAQEAEELYIVAHGILTFDESALPEALGNDSPPQTSIPARFDGTALTQTGFDYDFDRSITLEVLCFGPWCGGAGSDVDYLTFLRQDDSGYVMVADPCASLLFQDPSPENLATVTQCFKDGRCPPTGSQ